MGRCTDRTCVCAASARLNPTQQVSALPSYHTNKHLHLHLYTHLAVGAPGTRESHHQWAASAALRQCAWCLASGLQSGNGARKQQRVCGVESIHRVVVSLLLTVLLPDRMLTDSVNISPTHPDIPQHTPPPTPTLVNEVKSCSALLQRLLDVGQARHACICGRSDSKHTNSTSKVEHYMSAPLSGCVCTQPQCPLLHGHNCH